MRKLRMGTEQFDRKRGVFAVLALALIGPCLVFVPCYAADKGFYVEVPYARQTGNYCGPSALSMVLCYWGRPVDQYALAGAFSPFPTRGLSGTQLKELAAGYQFAAYSFSGSSEIMLEHLRKGRPLIVALSSSRLLNMIHYVVLVGWDAPKRDWIVHDPADGPYRRISEQKFRDRWAELKNWTLLVLPESGK